MVAVEFPPEGEYPLLRGAGAGSSSNMEVPRSKSVRPSPCPAATVLLESVVFQKSEMLMFKKVGSKVFVGNQVVGAIVGRPEVGGEVGGVVGSGVGGTDGGSVN